MIEDSKSFRNNDIIQHVIYMLTLRKTHGYLG